MKRKKRKYTKNFSWKWFGIKSEKSVIEFWKKLEVMKLRWDALVRYYGSEEEAIRQHEIMMKRAGQYFLPRTLDL